MIKIIKWLMELDTDYLLGIGSTFMCIVTLIVYAVKHFNKKKVGGIEMKTLDFTELGFTLTDKVTVPTKFGNCSVCLYTTKDTYYDESGEEIDISISVLEKVDDYRIHLRVEHETELRSGNIKGEDAIEWVKNGIETVKVTHNDW